LTEINKTNPITVFSWNYQDWPKEFDARPAVYGEAFNREVSQSKIVLGFSVEANCWGYWSNRVGKTLLAGGFLLQQYAPGMELFLRDGVEYFSNIEEAREKIDHYLIAESERQAVVDRGLDLAHERFSSKERVKDLMILIERYLKKGDIEWQI
jgi:spore maturation protein CgeB